MHAIQESSFAVTNFCKLITNFFTMETAFSSRNCPPQTAHMPRHKFCIEVKEFNQPRYVS